MAAAAKTKHEVVSEFRCAGILDAARRVFASRGFSEATVDEIASAAGIAKGTVYLYFPSKKDIYLAALMQGFTELQVRTREAMDAADGIRAKLRSFVATRLAYAEANRDFIHIYHSEFGNLANATATDNEFQKLYLKQAKALEGVLQDAVSNGEMRSTRTDLAAFVIYDIVKSVMMQRLRGWSKGTVDEDIELANHMIWKGIAGR
jgi:AcrR family transcriptional regulator